MGELIATLDSYSIYKSYINDKDNYYLCVPNGNINHCQIVLGFSDESLDLLSRDEVIAKIKKINDMVQSINNDSIYAVPNIPVDELKEAAIENDDRLYLNILNNKILPVTMDIYNMLIKNGIKQKNINHVVHVVKRTEADKKFAGWMAMKYGDLYISEIDYDELLEKYREKQNMYKIEIGGKDESGVSIPIGDVPLEQIQESQSIFESGIAPVNHDYENTLIEGKKNKLVRRFTKNNDKSPGFSSFKFIITTLLMSLVIGVAIGYLLLK